MVKGQRHLLKFVVTLASVAMTFAVLEGIVRLIDSRHHPRSTSPSPPLFVKCGDCPPLYRMNPDHPDISTQGLRDREYAIPKPPDVLRIMVLGDSVTYGFKVDLAATFAKRLERLLDGKYGRVEVVNAGVNGYSPYTELQYFLSEGRAFQADVVVVAFCMNDVADPELEWNWDAAARPGMHSTNLGLQNIPEDAIPDHAYNRYHARPRLEALRRRAQSRWHYSRLYTFVKRRLERMQQPSTPRDAVGRPVQITGGDTLGIDTLLDRNAPRMHWLKSMYGRLGDAVRREGATPMAVILPLAYQIDRNYPYLPQDVIGRQCKENNLPCLDVLPAFRQHADGDLFLGKRSRFDDIWHLSETGHQLVAEQLAGFLVEHGLLRRR